MIVIICEEGGKKRREGGGGRGKEYTEDMEYFIYRIKFIIFLYYAKKIHENVHVYMFEYASLGARAI